MPEHEKPVYFVCYTRGGKKTRDPYVFYEDAEKEARAISNVGGIVHIEQMVRYVHARFEKGKQTLRAPYTLQGSMTEYL